MKHCRQMSGEHGPAQQADPPPAWRRVLPWTIAAAILGYLAVTIPLDQVAGAIGRTSVPRLVALAAALVAGLLLADGLAMWVGFREALGPGLRYRDLVVVRGASYLLAVLNYGAGQGGIVYFLRERHGVGVVAGLGAVLLTSGAFIVVVALAVALGLAAGAVPEHPGLVAVVVAVAAALPAYLLVIALRPAFLARRAFLGPLLRAGVGGTLRVAAARAPHLAVLIVGHWLALRLFGVQVPLAAALTLLPVMFLVGALPLAPSGLGTTQAAAITLFAGFAPGDEAARHAAVLAYSLSLQAVGTVLSASVGLACLRLATATSRPHTGAHDSGSGGPDFSERPRPD
jgi:uncharacterized membrane protein YbhN (UPF0104 family)